jgi:hypothetical protein
MVLTAARDDLFVAANGTIACVNGATGQRRWRRALANAGVIVQLFEREWTLYAVTAGDSLTIGLLALDAVTGALRWAQKALSASIVGAAPEGILVSRILSDPGGGGALTLIGSDGVELARVMTEGVLRGAIAAANSRDGNLVIRTDAGRLTGLKVVSRAAAPAPLARLVGVVKVCFEGSCIPQARAPVEAAAADGTEERPGRAITNHDGRFTLSVHKGLLTKVSIDPAFVSSLEESRSRRLRAAQPIMQGLDGRVRCQASERTAVLAWHGGVQPTVTLVVDCRIVMPD